MYEPLTKTSGIEAVNKYLASFAVETSADGLTLATGDAGGLAQSVAIPDRLRTWLTDVRLLRGVPLACLVPDADLLPPESIRFFHVDQTWVDRIVDGIFAAANTGTVDFVFSYSMLRLIREALDLELTALAAAQVPGTAWTGDQPMTGMLIRSELARRWPDMIVRAYTSSSNMNSPMPVLRAESISKDIYIALFAGQPAMVHVREPNVGTRYGVEPRSNPTQQHPYKVDYRPENGDTAENAPEIIIEFRGDRVVNLWELGHDSVVNTTRQVALNLEQLPYVQEFKIVHEEERGSKEPEAFGTTMTFRGNRFMKLDSFKARRAERQAMEG